MFLTNIGATNKQNILYISQYLYYLMKMNYLLTNTLLLKENAIYLFLYFVYITTSIFLQKRYYSISDDLTDNKTRT